MNNCRIVVYCFDFKNNKCYFKININVFVFLVSVVLVVMIGLYNIRICNMLKELDMICEDNFVEEKEKCEEVKKGIYCCFER